jgi:hypothetical protein
MLIIACFTDTGSPKTGLSPIINVWKSDGVLVVDEQGMVERAGGFYDYNFSSYDGNENYVFRADGGSSLSDYDRYVYGTNDVSGLAKTGEYDATLSGIQADLDNPDQYKADTLGLAPAGEYDATLSGIQADLDNPDQYKADLNNVEAYMLRALGLMQENQYLDQTIYTNYQGIKLLTSGRIRAYSVASSVGTGSDVIATYQITITWNGDEMTSYKVIKI